ncbi:MAG: alpha-mannosidase [Acidobacteria bacterium]|nr:alpha-mannosidase [Acidobacteriota bacterium]
MPDRLVLHVVPHTHWDREWYEPFESYRIRLVTMLDELLELLERDPAFRHFHLDGQTAAIEDYLAVRPEQRPRVEALVRAGRLAIGPWRILADEFLCSPETILRNLAQGRASAERLGGRMRIGYLPDSFGHISQMPQILQLAGLSDACVWRGVPSAIDRTAFWWESPDGSRVRALYLATSYSNAASLPVSLDELMRRVRRIAADLSPFRPGGTLLAMNGTDHRAPEPHVPALIEEANRIDDQVELRIGSLEEYLAAAPSGDGLPAWRGELRSGARAHLLMGVASARVGLKQAELRASTLLERYAEPLAALAGRDWDRLLARAWRWMVENSAHDSICGCGVDAVADQVAGRYRQAAGIAEAVAREALESLGARVDCPGGVLVFNPSPRPRSSVVCVRPPGDGGPLRAPDGSEVGVQIVGTERAVVVDMTLDAPQLARIVPTIHSRALGEHHINGLSIEEGSPTTVRLDLGAAPVGTLDVEAGKRAVEQAIRAQPDGRFRVLGLAPAAATALVRTPEIGGLGWTVLSPLARAAGAPAPREGTSTAPVDGAAGADGRAIWNGALAVEVRADGSVNLEHIASGTRFQGLLLLEDGGDVGDEYNYSPPARDRVVRSPAGAVSVEVVEMGPLRATVRARGEWALPAALGPGGTGRSRTTVRMPVEIDLTLHAGEPFLRTRISIDNRARDHRLRVLFPLPFRAERSQADGAFDVVERGLEAEGGPHERPLATFPCRRWVDASGGRMGLAVLHRGTPEFELGRALAVTLLRSVGWLSRQGMRYRPGPAGPALATPGAQCLGPHVFDLAIYPHEGDWRAGEVHRAAEAYLYEPWSLSVPPHSGDLPVSGAGLEIEPSCVQLSALSREGSGVLCRVWNASPEPVRALLRPGPLLAAARATLVDLAGAAIAPLDVTGGVVALPLRAWQIATVRLAPSEHVARHVPNRVTEAMDRALGEIDEPVDRFVKAASRRILERGA